MAINEANVGYLPRVVLKEIRAGRKCDVTGGVCRAIATLDEYNQAYSNLRGKFGEIIQEKDGRVVIATRPVPVWAIDNWEKHMDEAAEMARWPA